MVSIQHGLLLQELREILKVLIRSIGLVDVITKFDLYVKPHLTSLHPIFFLHITVSKFKNLFFFHIDKKENFLLLFFRSYFAVHA